MIIIIIIVISQQSFYHSNYHRSVRLSDQKIQKLPRAAEVRCSLGSSAKNLPSGISKNTEESFGHKVEEQEITSRKN